MSHSIVKNIMLYNNNNNNISMKVIFLITIIGSVCLKAISQEKVYGVGDWSFHLPYNFTSKIAVTDEKAYAATQYGLFSVDKKMRNVSKVTKVDGLSDVSISALEYDERSEILFIGYSNGNIDILRGNEITNIDAIKRSTSIIGSKQINSVNFYLSDAYVSTEFGVIVFSLEDPAKIEVKESYLDIGENGSRIGVSKITFFNDSIQLSLQKVSRRQN